MDRTSLDRALQRRVLTLVAFAFTGIVGWGFFGFTALSEPSPGSPVSQAIPYDPASEKQPEELAEYMSRLQAYTHKLSLSVKAGNEPLAGLYLHESVALLEQIQKVFPEYERIPVALYIARLALGAYEPLKTSLEKPAAERAKGELDAGMDIVIQACNACHTTSQVPFIRIERNDFNPFLQSFQPLTAPKP
jgi:hypothetical protein